MRFFFSVLLSSISFAIEERWYPICVGDISIDHEWRRLFWEVNESSEEAAARLDIKKKSGIQEIAAFLEHREALVRSIKLEFRQCLQKGMRNGAPAVAFFQMNCSGNGKLEDDIPLDRIGRWLLLDSNTWNPQVQQDWNFFLGEQYIYKLSAIAITSLPSQHETLHSSILQQAFHSLLPGGVLWLPKKYSLQNQSYFKFGLGPGLDQERHGPSAPHLEVSDQLVPYHKPIDIVTSRGDKIMVINLDRRPDRLATTSARISAAWRLPSARVGEDFERIVAIDGQKLDLMNPDLKYFNLSNFWFEPNKKRRRNPHQDHGYRPAVLGCALSHIKAWRRLIASIENEEEYALILEDDVIFVHDFFERWQNMSKMILNQDFTWDIVQFGVLDDRDLYNDERIVLENSILPLIKFSASKRTFGAGAFAYLLRKRAARKLLQLTREIGIQQAIDWWLIDRYDIDLVAYKVQPALAISPQGEGRDSDNDEAYDSRRLLLHKLEEEINYGGGEAFFNPKYAQGKSNLVRFSLLEPLPGSAFIIGDQVSITGQLLTSAIYPTLFPLQYPTARICLNVTYMNVTSIPTLINHCNSILNSQPLLIPAHALLQAGWYRLDLLLTIDDNSFLVLADAVFIEILRHQLDLRNLPPPLNFSTISSTATAAVDVLLDGVPALLHCPYNDGPALYACAHQLCSSNSIQPLLDCVASLTATLPLSLIWISSFTYFCYLIFYIVSRLLFFLCKDREVGSRRAHNTMYVQQHTASRDHMGSRCTRARAERFFFSDYIGARCGKLYGTFYSLNVNTS